MQTQPKVKCSKLDGTALYVVFEQDVERVVEILDDICGCSGSYTGMKEFRKSLEKHFPDQTWDAYELDILATAQLESRIISDVIEDTCYEHVKIDTPAYKAAKERCDVMIREAVNTTMFKIIVEYNSSKNLIHPTHHDATEQLIQAITFLLSECQLPNCIVYKVVPININHELFLNQVKED